MAVGEEAVVDELADLAAGHVVAEPVGAVAVATHPAMYDYVLDEQPEQGAGWHVCA